MSDPLLERIARNFRREEQARKLRRKALDALDASEMVFARTRGKLASGLPFDTEAYERFRSSPVRYSKEFIAEL